MIKEVQERMKNIRKGIGALIWLLKERDYKCPICGCKGEKIDEKASFMIHYIFGSNGNVDIKHYTATELLRVTCNECGHQELFEVDKLARMADKLTKEGKKLDLPSMDEIMQANYEDKLPEQDAIAAILNALNC